MLAFQFWKIPKFSLISFQTLQSTEVIFDSILPEWALAAFCKQFKLTRFEAIERMKLQSKYLIEMMNDSD